jgi:hypothetical protein
VQRAFGYRSRLITDHSSTHLSRWDRALEKLNSDSPHKWDMAWDWLCMLAQLRLLFTTSHWADMCKQIRVDKARPDSTDTALPYYASRKSGRDLRDFFRRWGFPMTAEADRLVTEMNLPTLEFSEYRDLREH